MDKTIYFDEILGIIDKLYKEANTYTQEDIVNFIVDTHASEWGFEKDEISLFKAWLRGIVRTYFYFKRNV